MQTPLPLGQGCATSWSPYAAASFFFFFFFFSAFSSAAAGASSSAASAFRFLRREVRSRAAAGQARQARTWTHAQLTLALHLAQRLATAAEWRTPRLSTQQHQWALATPPAMPTNPTSAHLCSLVLLLLLLLLLLALAHGLALSRGVAQRANHLLWAERQARSRSGQWGRGAGGVEQRGLAAASSCAAAAAPSALTGRRAS